MDILEFSEKIINGVGGLHDFEHYEMASPKYDRDVSVAIWVIKCLANPWCEGSEEAVQAITERRNKLAAEQSVQRTAGDVRPHREPCICAACEDYDNFHASRR